ncbi:MAG: hypothetical protein IJK46_13375 [Prevotella sp.]|nr:hypothetical protein [Prevotella sp.]
MEITKNRYLTCFAAIVFLLAVVRLIFPSVARNHEANRAIEIADSLRADSLRKVEEAKLAAAKIEVEKAEKERKADSIKKAKQAQESAAKVIDNTENKQIASPFFNPDGTEVKHRIFSVPRYSEAFPDSQQVQYASAQKWGVASVQNRKEAENRKRELVYVGSSPYYFIEKMNRSIPYLVPRAAILLNDIGRAYFDSLQMKQVPLHKFIVTSVLRTKDDVVKLRNYNQNATENSCHLYGTTFDICYNRYKTVQDPDGPHRREVRNDTLKWVLCEVLNDMRKNNRCYIKYEVKQGCFHITVR